MVKSSTVLGVAALGVGAYATYRIVNSTPEERVLGGASTIFNFGGLLDNLGIPQTPLTSGGGNLIANFTEGTKEAFSGVTETAKNLVPNTIDTITDTGKNIISTTGDGLASLLPDFSSSQLPNLDIIAADSDKPSLANRFGQFLANIPIDVVKGIFGAGEKAGAELGKNVGGALGRTAASIRDNARFENREALPQNFGDALIRAFAPLGVRNPLDFFTGKRNSNQAGSPSLFNRLKDTVTSAPKEAVESIASVSSSSVSSSTKRRGGGSSRSSRRRVSSNASSTPSNANFSSITGVSKFVPRPSSRNFTDAGSNFSSLKRGAIRV